MNVSSMRPALCLAIGLAGSAALPAARAQSFMPDDIAPFEVVYDVGNNLITAGNATLSLAKEGNNWVYSLSTRPKGIFKLTGKGRINEVAVIELVESDDQVTLQPQTYSFRQDKERRRSVDAQFDWEGNALTYRKRGEEVTENFSDPVLDRLSVTLAIMNALRHGFDRATLQVFDNGKIKTVEFINEGTEMLKTRLGEVETIRVSNRNTEGSSRSTMTWFAPSLDYVPVKIEHSKRDELVARLTIMKLRNRTTDVDMTGSEADEAGTADTNEADTSGEDATAEGAESQ